MFTVEVQTRHRLSRRTVYGYRTSRQPHVPAALAYARDLWRCMDKAYGRGCRAEVTLRNDAGRIVHRVQWERV